MGRRIVICLVAFAVIIMPALNLAEDLRDRGDLVVDGGDYQIYRLHEDGEPVQDAADTEDIALNGGNETRVKGLLTYAEDGSGITRPWFSLGTPINLSCHFYTFESGEVQINLNIRGPNRYRERIVIDPLSGDAGGWSVIALGIEFPSPGFYTFTFIIRSRNRVRLRGTVHVFPVS